MAAVAGVAVDAGAAGKPPSLSFYYIGHANCTSQWNCRS